MKGLLVAFEGIDNCGKTTQSNLVSAHFESLGIGCVVTRELTTPIGALIRSYFRREDFTPILKTLLFAADRMQRQEQIVRSALASGKIVIADRWTLSAVVYRKAEGLSSDFVSQVNAFALHPDLTILIDIDAATSEKRGRESGKSCPYPQEFLEKVRLIYLAIAKSTELPVLDGTGAVGGVTRQLLDLIKC